MNRFTESTVEEAALMWFEELGYSVLSGPEIAPEEPAAERTTFGEIILPDRFLKASSTNRIVNIPIWLV